MTRRPMKIVRVRLSGIMKASFTYRLVNTNSENLN